MIPIASNLKAVIKPSKPRLIPARTRDALEENLLRVRKHQVEIRRYYRSKLRG